MQYRDSSSSSGDDDDEYAQHTPLASGEQSAPAFRVSQPGTGNTRGESAASTTASAGIGAVKMTDPAHVTTQLHTQLLKHSDDDEDDEDNDNDDSAKGQSQSAARASADDTGFNSTVFMMRPSAAVVRKFHVLDSGDDDDDGTHDEAAPDAEATPSRNKGLRDGQNVSVASEENEKHASPSASSASSSSSVQEVRASAPATVQPLMVKRMLPPTPSLSSSSSSVEPVRRPAARISSGDDSDDGDDDTAEQLHQATSRALPESVGAGTTAMDTTESAVERQVAPLVTGVDDVSAPASSPAATVATVEKMCPSPSSSSSSSSSSHATDTAAELAQTPLPVDDLGTLPTHTTGTEKNRRTSASAPRMLPPPSTESSSSSASSSSPVQMRPPPPPVTLLAPTFADDHGEPDEVYEDGQEEEVYEQEEEDEEDEEEAVIFHDIPSHSAGAEDDAIPSDADSLDREFPLRDCDAGMFSGMTLLDSTAFTTIYESTTALPGEEDVVLSSVMKLVCPFGGVWGEPHTPENQTTEDTRDGAPRLVRAAQREELNAAQAQLQRAARWMMQSQLQLADSGLTAPCGPDEAVCCRGVARLWVDREARLLGELEQEGCVLPLSTIVAFASAVPSALDVVALIGSITVKVAMLHERGLVHGALHASNVLCSTDDGHTVLTQPCGVLAQLALPADPSFLTPRQAARLWPLVRDVWQEGGTAADATTTPSAAGRLGRPVEGLDSAEKIKQHTQRLFVASEEAKAAQEAQRTAGGEAVRGMVLPWLGHVRPEDDVYALGLLAVALLMGVPALHGLAVKDVLPALEQLGEQAATAGATKQADSLSRWVRETLVEPLHRTDSFVARAALSDYSADFTALVFQFIADCLSSGFDTSGPGGHRYHDAVTLLQHPFFQQYLPDYTVGPEAMMADQDALNTAADEVDRVHRYVYPVYSQTCSVESNCGSSPYLVRAHANAIFASRRHALCDARVPHTAVALLWPPLEGRPRGWSPQHPSVTSCQPDATLTASALEAARVPALYFPPCAHRPSPPCTALQQKQTLEAAKDCTVLLNLHTILFDALDGAVVRLTGDDLAPLRHSVDKLVLRNLHNCRVEILTHFRYVVLDHVTECDVVLGPCFGCHMRHVHRCPSLAVACTYMVLEEVTDCGVQFAGLISPTARDGTVRDVRLQPYSVAYAGLAQDYAAVGLAFEHVATLPFFDAAANEPVQRHLRYLQAGETTAQDFPYAVSLVATGSSFVHRDDATSDVYVFYKELSGKDVLISHIEGKTSAEASAPALETESCLDRLARLAAMSSDPARSQACRRRPLIFILDAVGDVKIEHCRHCTIVVVGATGSAEVRHCHDVDLFLMAKECVLEHCTQLRVRAFVTEFMALVSCRGLVLEPLILECPYFDAILKAVIDSSDGSSEDEVSTWEQLVAAHDAADMDTLNVVLQGNGRTIDVSQCVEVELHDAEWLAMNPSSALTMVTIPVSPLALSTTGTEAVACNFFARYCQRHRTTPEQSFLHQTLADVLQDGRAAPPLVKIHNLLAASVLRLRGGLQLRSTPTCDGAVATTPDSLPDLLIEHIHLGEVHIAEPVGSVLIRHCTGPLEIAVCSAQHVLLENCVNVTVRVACRDLVARGCHHCHLASHVNSAPRYVRCGAMLTSALNMTTEGMESLLDSTGVQLDVNRFDVPVLLPATMATASLAAVLAYVPMTATEDEVADVPRKATALHQYCAETQMALSLGISPTSPGSLRVESLAQCFGLLCRPVHIVPPLSGLCVGVVEAGFVESLDARVNREERQRIPLDSVLMAALAFFTSDELDLRASDAAMEPTDAPETKAESVGEAREEEHEEQEAEQEEEPAQHAVLAEAKTVAYADTEPSSPPVGPVPHLPHDADEDESDGVDPPRAAPAVLVAEHASTRDRYEECSSSSSDVDDAAMIVVPPLDSREPSPRADNSGFAPVTQLASSGVEHAGAMQRLRDGADRAEGSPLFDYDGLPVAACHIDVNDDSRLDGEANLATGDSAPAGPRADTSLPADPLHPNGPPHHGYERMPSVPLKPDSVPVDASLLARPPLSVLTSGLSVASPPAILRAPVQASLNAGSPGRAEPSAVGVPPMPSLQPAGDSAAAPSPARSPASHREPESSQSTSAEDDVNVADPSDDSGVNLGDTAREVSFSSSAQSYERGRGDGHADAANDGARAVPKPAAFLHLDESHEADDDDGLVATRGPLLAAAPVIDIPYVDDADEGRRLLSHLAADGDTVETLQEALDDVRAAKRVYQDTAEVTGVSFHERVERALRVIRSRQ